MIRLWSTCLLLLVLSGCGFRSEEADLVLHNGRVLTLDGELTVAEAVAVRKALLIVGHWFL